MPFINSVRGNFGGIGVVGNTAPPLITISGTTYNLLTDTITLSTANEYSMSVFSRCQVRVKVWGAGGGGSQPGGWGGSSVGGSGGHSSGVVSLSAGTSKIIVGEGGSGNSFRYVIGGGHSSQPGGGMTDNRYSACGGGFSGIFSGSGAVHDATGGTGNTTYRTSGVQARALIIAGGGGGGGNASGQDNNRHIGGHGGGSSGTGGMVNGSVNSTTAGSQTSTGATGFGDQWGGTVSPAFMGAGAGSGQGYGGGGGGGYFGGSCGERSSFMPGGGGGSGFLHPSLVTSGSTTAGSGQTSPGGSGVAGYIGGVGRGGDVGSSSSNSWNGGAGGNGLVIISPL